MAAGKWYPALAEDWEKPTLEQTGSKDSVGWRGEAKAQPSSKIPKHSNIMKSFTQALFRAAINEGKDCKAANSPHYPPSTARA